MALYGPYRVAHDELNNETFIKCSAHNIWECPDCQHAEEQADAVRKALELLTTMERELSRVGVRPNFDGLRDELENWREDND